MCVVSIRPARRASQGKGKATLGRAGVGLELGVGSSAVMSITSARR